MSNLIQAAQEGGWELVAQQSNSKRQCRVCNLGSSRIRTCRAVLARSCWISLPSLHEFAELQQFSGRFKVFSFWRHLTTFNDPKSEAIWTLGLAGAAGGDGSSTLSLTAVPCLQRRDVWSIEVVLGRRCKNLESTTVPLTIFDRSPALLLWPRRNQCTGMWDYVGLLSNNVVSSIQLISTRLHFVSYKKRITFNGTSVFFLTQAS